MSTSTPACCPSCGALLEQGEHNPADGLCPRCLLADFLQSTIAGQPSALPPSLEEVAAAFPELEIIELIGRGGMSAVYKAKQRSLDRLVALKLLPQALATDPEFVRRFEAEAKALANLNHGNIVTVHEFGQRDTFCFLMMEYVDGPNLRQLLQDHRLSPQEALSIVPPLCDALEYAHQRRIVHCDIKPENLLFTTEGKVKIADFGIARILGQTGVESQKTAGTPAYMAPEQKHGPHAIDTRADIYSLGVVIYEMLTGERPGSELAPPSAKNGALDVHLDQIVLRALEENPSSRWPSVNALHTELRTYLTERLGESKVVPPKKLPMSAPWLARLAGGFSFAALVVFLVSHCGALMMRPLPDQAHQAYIDSFHSYLLKAHDLDKQLLVKHTPEVWEERSAMLRNIPVDPSRPGISDPLISRDFYHRGMLLSVFLFLIGIVFGVRHLSWLRGCKEPLPALKAALIATVHGPVVLASLSMLPIFYQLLYPHSPVEPVLMSVMVLALLFVLVVWITRRLAAWARNLRHAPPFRLPLAVVTALVAVSAAIPFTYGHLNYRKESLKLWEETKQAAEDCSDAFKAIQIDFDKEGAERYSPQQQVEESRRSVANKVKTSQRFLLHSAQPFHWSLPELALTGAIAFYMVSLIPLLLAIVIFRKYRTRSSR